MPKRPSKEWKRRSPAYERSESRSYSTCWVSRLTLGRHEGCSSVPRGRQGFGLYHLLKLPPGPPPALGHPAHHLLGVLLLGQRRARPDLARDLRQGQHHDVRVDVALLEQAHHRPLEPLRRGPELR